MNEQSYKERVFDVADSIYFEFIDNLNDSSEFIEIDPENPKGTRNTEKGSELYYSIENKLINLLKEDSQWSVWIVVLMKELCLKSFKRTKK